MTCDVSERLKSSCDRNSVDSLKDWVRRYLGVRSRSVIDQALQISGNVMFFIVVAVTAKRSYKTSSWLPWFMIFVMPQAKDLAQVGFLPQKELVTPSTR